MALRPPAPAALRWYVERPRPETGLRSADGLAGQQRANVGEIQKKGGSVLTWDDYFLLLADAVAARSKDRSSQLGAVVVGPDREIRATGYNGFPRGYDDQADANHARPAKYRLTEHAERNAIYNAARHGASLQGCVLYCEWPPCSDCARAIVQAGIVEVVTRYAGEDCPERWHEDMAVAAEILDTCGVTRRRGNE